VLTVTPGHGLQSVPALVARRRQGLPATGPFMPSFAMAAYGAVRLKRLAETYALPELTGQEMIRTYSMKYHTVNNDLTVGQRPCVDAG
jgi:hypothetical protein